VPDNIVFEYTNAKSDLNPGELYGATFPMNRVGVARDQSLLRGVQGPAIGLRHRFRVLADHPRHGRIPQL
jgi:hypothetical protein